jgi:hypothetical protein
VVSRGGGQLKACERAGARCVTLPAQLKTKYVLAGQFDVARQEQLSRTVAGALGFDWSVGRLDQSVHPFTGGPHPTDVRITTRFSDSDLLSALMGELGTTLYSSMHPSLSVDCAGAAALRWLCFYGAAGLATPTLGCRVSRRRNIPRSQHMRRVLTPQRRRRRAQARCTRRAMRCTSRGVTPRTTDFLCLKRSRWVSTSRRACCGSAWWARYSPPLLSACPRHAPCSAACLH